MEVLKNHQLCSYTNIARHKISLLCIVWLKSIKQRTVHNNSVLLSYISQDTIANCGNAVSFCKSILAAYVLKTKLLQAVESSIEIFVMLYVGYIK